MMIHVPMTLGKAIDIAETARRSADKYALSQSWGEKKAPREDSAKMAAFCARFREEARGGGASKTRMTGKEYKSSVMAFYLELEEFRDFIRCLVRCADYAEFASADVAALRIRKAILPSRMEIDRILYPKSQEPLDRSKIDTRYGL